MPKSISKDLPRVPEACVRAFRLGRHHLATRAARHDAVRVVQDIVGVQAQLLSAAQLSLRARVAGLAREEVDRLLWKDRALVKAWSMRGALHLLAADDLAFIVAGLGPHTQWGAETWLVRSGLPVDEADRILRAVAVVLDDGPLTRRELAAAVAGRAEPASRRWIEHSWGGVLKLAASRGLVCFGPNRGNEITFVRRDRWLPSLVDVQVAEAERRLATRYLRAYGPATVQDFAAWAGIPLRDARGPWSRIAEDLVPVAVDRGEAWILREDLASLRAATDGPVVRLLPSFDAFLLGHKDKGHIVASEHYKEVYRKAGWLSPVILVDGRAAGVWSYKRRGQRLQVIARPFQRVSWAVREGIESEVDDLGRFFEASADVTFVP